LRIIGEVQLLTHLLIFQQKHSNQQYCHEFFVFLQPKSKAMENPTLEQKVISIIDQIRPYLEQDGGNIEFVELTTDNVVKVRLQGACGTCPHAKMTLKNGVEQTIKHYLPEIDHVEDVVLGF